MRGVVSARCPHKKDDPCAPHAKALKPQFAVVLAVILHRDHGRVEDRFRVCEIDSVLSEVFTAFRLVPGDHEQTVYAGYASVKQIVDADERESKGPGSIDRRPLKFDTKRHKLLIHMKRASNFATTGEVVVNFYVVFRSSKRAARQPVLG